MTQSMMVEDISRLIYRQLMGTLTDDERRRLETWMAESEDNRLAVNRLTDRRHLSDEYRRRQAVDVSRPLADMKRRIGQRSWVAKVSSYAAAAVVALLLAGAGVTLWHVRTASSRQHSATAVAADSITPGTTQAVLTLASGETFRLGSDTIYNNKVLADTKTSTDASRLSTLSTPRGGEFRVVFEDGTEVWLNAESQLRYPDTFDGAERRVEVSGEAYFRVAKDPERPFVVEAAGQLIRVTGTEFNVNSYADDRHVYTTLVSGSITTSLLTATDSELKLTPGHQTVVETGADVMRVRSVDTATVTSWRRGKFVFENQTLEQMMRALARWYDFQYKFEDEDLRQTEFMGTMPRYADFAEVLDILEKSGGLRFSRHGRCITISKR